MDYYLGIDIGTTSSKAVAFADTGQILVSHACYYTMLHPQPNYSELDANEVYTAVIASCNKVVESMQGQAPLFIAFSAAMHSIMAVDEDGVPLTNCIIWADNRAAEIARELLKSDKAAFVYRTTGVPIHPMSPLCKLLWFKAHQPEIFYLAHKFIGIKEYVWYKLTGSFIVDTSIASSTGLLNIETLCWEPEILLMVSLTEASFSQLVSPKFTVEINAMQVMAAGLTCNGSIKLVAGASDGALANFGAGTSDGKSLVITIGTSSAARLLIRKPELDEGMRTFCYHLKDELYVIGGPGNNGAIVLQWLKEKLLQTTDSYVGMFSKAEMVDAGSESLLFLPYILGERAPIWNSDARGVFFGLNINHTSSHLIRACMEGIIFSVYSIAQVLFEKRTITGIHATGGFAQSQVWVQMLADVCNRKVFVSQALETSALGAVMLGVEALELTSLLPSEKGYVVEPNLVAHGVYMQSFKRFQGLYQALTHQWKHEEYGPEMVVT